MGDHVKEVEETEAGNAGVSRICATLKSILCSGGKEWSLHYTSSSRSCADSNYLQLFQ